LWIVTYQDTEIEAVNNIAFKIEVQSLAEKYLLHPDNVFPSAEVAVHPPRCLDIHFTWDSDDDIDFVIFKDGETYRNPAFSDMGATSASTEVDNSITLSKVGTYYVGILHWDAPSFGYTFTLGKPDATTETITGTFTSDDLKAYYVDNFDGWGAGSVYPSYRVLKIVNDGTNFTVTKYNPLTSADYTAVAGLVGTWSGDDGALPNWSYTTTTVEITDVDGYSNIYGLNEGWMNDFWGETILEGNPVEMIVYSNGDVVIPYTYYWTTEFINAESDTIISDYYIYGVGTYDAGTGLHLEYELDQEGFFCASWAYDNNYSGSPYFYADLTKGKQFIQMEAKTKPVDFIKPEIKTKHIKKEIIKKY